MPRESPCYQRAPSSSKLCQRPHTRQKLPKTEKISSLRLKNWRRNWEKFDFQMICVNMSNPAMWWVFNCFNLIFEPIFRSVLKFSSQRELATVARRKLASLNRLMAQFLMIREHYYAEPWFWRRTRMASLNPRIIPVKPFSTTLSYRANQKSLKLGPQSSTMKHWKTIRSGDFTFILVTIHSLW